MNCSTESWTALGQAAREARPRGFNEHQNRLHPRETDRDLRARPVEQCEVTESFPSRESVGWVITQRTLRTTSAPVHGCPDTAFITPSASTRKARDASRLAQSGGDLRRIRYNCTAVLGSYHSGRLHRSSHRASHLAAVRGREREAHSRDPRQRDNEVSRRCAVNSRHGRRGGKAALARSSTATRPAFSADRQDCMVAPRHAGGADQGAPRRSSPRYRNTPAQASSDVRSKGLRRDRRSR
jgi:hypothetical protein